MNVKDYINQHKYIRYCECIIYPNGDIEDAEHGHQNKIMEATGKSKQELYQIIPRIAAPSLYLVGYTKCILVSYDFFIFNSITNEQLNTIQELVNHDILLDGIIGHYTDEFMRCNLRIQFDDGNISFDEFLKSLKKEEKENFQIWKGDK